MTCRGYAKLFRALGHINIGIALFDVVLIVFCLIHSIPVPAFTFLAAFGCAIMAPVCLYFADQSEQLAKVIEDDYETKEE